MFPMKSESGFQVFRYILLLKLYFLHYQFTRIYTYVYLKE